MSIKIRDDRHLRALTGLNREHFEIRMILFLVETFPGHTHDYTMLKEKFPTEKTWFEFLHVFVDLGYQGIVSDYLGEIIRIPHKKPRKSKKNPGLVLTSAN